jgi:Zn ribbon nucleic-acid-binding protein
MGNWQFNLHPLSDELLSSWLIRNAIANGSDPACFSIAVWGKWRAWTVDFDRQTPRNKLQILSRSSGVDKNTLQSMTLLPTIEKILPCRPNINTAWQWVVPTGGRNRTKINGLHYCPLCLSHKTHYFSKSGRLAWNTTCPVHKFQLISHCPKCHTTISPHLVTYDNANLHLCVSCGFNLQNSPTIKANDDVIALQNLLNNALIDRRTETLPLGSKEIGDLFGIVHFFMVFFLSIYKNKLIAKSLSKTLNVDLFTNKSKFMMEQRTNTERHALMLATSRILKFSKFELINLCLSLNITQEAFMRDNQSDVAIIQDINRHLPSAKRKKYNAAIIKNKVIPKSKCEVEALLATIKPYL